MACALVTVAALADTPAAIAALSSARRAGFDGPLWLAMPIAPAPSTIAELGDLGPCRVVTTADLGAPQIGPALPALRAETWCAAALPLLLGIVLDGGDGALFVAPSVECSGDPEALIPTDGGGLLLAPRPTAYPADGRHPDDFDRLAAAPFSPAVLATAGPARAALAWWAEHATAAIAAGRQLSIAQILPVLALRFGYQPLAPGHVDWFTTGSPEALTIDTAGHDPAHPHRLRSDGPLPHRVTTTAVAHLADALARRAERFTRAEWAVDLDVAPGVALDATMRAAYAHALGQPHRTPPISPLTDPGGFFRWVTDSEFVGPRRISRYLRAVYLARPDLSRAFPEVPGRDTERFHEWARLHGRTEVPIPDALLSASAAPVFELPAQRAVKRGGGVNIVGFSGHALGIGETPRRVAAMLSSLGVPYAQVPVSSHFEAPPAPHGLNIIVINPDSLLNLVHGASNGLLTNRYNIGIWAWETERLPPGYAFAFDIVDEVWCATEYVVDAVRAAAPPGFPVHKYDLPIYPPPVVAGFDPASLGVAPTRPALLCPFDYLSIAERKNPRGVIAAFRGAFSDGEGPLLVFKTLNAERRPDDHDRVRHSARGRSDIVFVDRELDAATNGALIAHAAAVVSLHRSEGYAYNLADAIALGRPVIATGYSGNLDFMGEMDESLVDYELVPVGAGHHPYPSEHRWAAPDLGAAARLMRSIVDDPPRWLAYAEVHRRRVLAAHSVEQAATTLGRLLQPDGSGPSRRGFLSKRR